MLALVEFFSAREGGKAMSRIVRATPCADHTLEIELDNRHRIIYDMKPRLKAVRFCQLADIDKFRSIRVENGDTIVWNNLCQITISEIISLVER